MLLILNNQDIAWFSFEYGELYFGKISPSNATGSYIWFLGTMLWRDQRTPLLVSVATDCYLIEERS